MVAQLFVYGTLMRGEDAFALIATASLRWSAAHLRNARLYDVGPYPIAVAGEGSVSGEVHWLAPAQLPQLLQTLDAYEGAAYARVSRTIDLPSGATCEAWVYLGEPANAAQYPLIHSGNWRQRG